MRVKLEVPYKQKDEAKRLGAKWDAAQQTWFVENKDDLGPFLKWMAPHLQKAHEPK